MELITGAISWLGDHWIEVIAGKAALDFVVKITPWKGDDVVIDVIWKALKAVAGEKDSEQPK